MKTYGIGGGLSRGLLLSVIAIIIAAAGIGGAAQESVPAGDDTTEAGGVRMDSASAPAEVGETGMLLEFLGADFARVRRALGEPDETGHSGLYGPHQYLLFTDVQGGTVRFCSPESDESRTVTSIIVGPGGDLLGTEVGMTFAEIQDVLGEADRGPEAGMDGLYHMEYHLPEVNGHRNVYLNYSASRPTGPTAQAFVGLRAVP